MSVKLAVCAALCVFSISQPALAAQPFNGDLTPQLALSLPLGGSSADGIPFHFAAQLTWGAGFPAYGFVESSAYVGAEHRIDPLQRAFSLDLITLSGNRRGITAATMFGQNMLKSHDRLDETGESDSGGHSWIWWTLGGIAAAGAAAAVAAGAHNSSNNVNNSNSGCVGVSGSAVGGQCYGAGGGS